MEAKNLICFSCKHYDVIDGNCAAFKEIPSEILSGGSKHKKPLKGQKNDIIFEKAQ
jgi:hypothetical protein